MKALKIIRNVIWLIVIIECIALTWLITNKIVDLKGRVEKLETQIVELQGDK